jgi:hypothetical protein
MFPGLAEIKRSLREPHNLKKAGALGNKQSLQAWGGRRIESVTTALMAVLRECRCERLARY